MAVLLDGKALSEQRMEELKARVAALKEKGRTVGLSVILVGENPASQVYVRNKGKACEALGIRGDTILLPERASQEELEALINKLNQDDSVDGILVQLPLTWTASTSKTRASCLRVRRGLSPARPRAFWPC